MVISCGHMTAAAFGIDALFCTGTLPLHFLAKIPSYHGGHFINYGMHVFFAISSPSNFPVLPSFLNCQ
jgi:hypothetical protein